MLALHKTESCVIYLTGICPSEGNAQGSLIDANSLEEEFRSGLNETRNLLLAELNKTGNFNFGVPTSLDCGVHTGFSVSQENKQVLSQFTQIRDLLVTKISKMFIPGYTPSHPAASCKEILQLAPQSPSGLYWIRGTDNGPKRMYCDLERSCKGVAGGWMRVASINMTDTNNSCPVGLRTLTSPRRRCAMDTDGPGCSSAVLPVEGIQYSQVCGMIIGYQDKSPDAFHRFIIGQNTIDSNYVDGISITHGQSPRKHIWTFAAALHEDNSAEAAPKTCACTNTSTDQYTASPSFVGNDYFCDTGSANYFQYIFYGDDPLWDGAGCGQYSTCCDWNSPPWFRKQLSTSTSDDIEMRMCADQPLNDEDINFEALELYVQ